MNKTLKDEIEKKNFVNIKLNTNSNQNNKDQN
jgi:hypothetical protein